MIFLPKKDEKLHENKEIRVKNPLSAKVYTREIYWKGHPRKFIPAKLNLGTRRPRKFVPAKVSTFSLDHFIEILWGEQFVIILGEGVWGSFKSGFICRSVCMYNKKF